MHRDVPYKDREAWADDAALVIEAAHRSLTYDRSIKRSVHAQAGIPEYWIVDCDAEAVEVHRHPAGDGDRGLRVV
jgi:Uma2 family endonuclease